MLRFQSEMAALDQVRTPRNAIRAIKNSMSRISGLHDFPGTNDGGCPDEIASRTGLREGAALPRPSSPGT